MNIRLAALSAAILSLASGAANSFSGAIQAAQMRLSQPKPIEESKTRQIGSLGGYTKARTPRAVAKRAARKARNVARNRRAHRS